MNLLYDLRDWFYECDRLLFLAEVHYHKEDVVPYEHRFSHELTSNYLECIISEFREISKKSEYCAGFDACMCQEELSFLKRILDHISSNEWDKMDIDDVLKAQDIVHVFADAVNADIRENCELRGYPHIYNACKIK
ncbi:hypothetical protein [Methanolobus sp. WCC5]|uniref:hypothetical protein n=1 Tax=Methanolobus sp. WCC5 TaxID=3125785 RepID=UPI00324B8588